MPKEISEVIIREWKLSLSCNELREIKANGNVIPSFLKNRQKGGRFKQAPAKCDPIDSITCALLVPLLQPLWIEVPLEKLVLF